MADGGEKRRDGEVRKDGRLRKDEGGLRGYLGEGRDFHVRFRK